MMTDKVFGREEENGIDDIESLQKALAQADAVVIGAGAGLSVSAGFTYTGERFQKYFGDFAEIYSFRDMYSGGFYPFETPEEYWAYWSRYIYINRYMDAPKPVYKDVYGLVKDKDYFVLTTNVDHCFQKAGFDKQRLFYTQGDYGLFQCSVPCHQRTYDNEYIVRRMMERQKDRKIPEELVPRCPVCKKPMSMNLRADNTFVEDEGWHRAAERYSAFLKQHGNKKTLFLDLGTGMNTPGIVKFSFWRMVFEWPDAVYCCINLTDACVPEKIIEKSICIDRDAGSVLDELKKRFGS